MSDFLDSLANRSLGTERTLRPQLPSRFEPLRYAPNFGGDSLDPQSNGLDATDRPLRQNSEVEGVADHRDRSPLTPQASLSEQVRPRTTPPPVTESIPRYDVNHQPKVEPQDANTRRVDVPLLSSLQSLPPELSPLPAMAEPEVDHAIRVDGLKDSSRSNVDSRNDQKAAASTQPPLLDISGDRWLSGRLSDLSTQLKQMRDEHFGGNFNRAVDVTSAQESSPVPPPALLTKLVENSPDVRREPAESTGQDELPMRRPPMPSPTANPEAVVSSPVRQNSREEMLSLLGQSQMQPVPQIVPEQLPVSKHSAPPQPTINVTIGRVEVKATREPVAPRPAKPAHNSAVMSLQDYLKHRASGGLR